MPNHPPENASVEVLLFSVLRERIGASNLTITLDGPIAASALLTRLAETYPAIEPARSSIRVAVNQEYVDLEHVIEHGDEVALITPVSGG